MTHDVLRVAACLRGDGQFTFGPFEAVNDGDPGGWAVMRSYRNRFGHADCSILCTGMDEPEAGATAAALNQFLADNPADAQEPVSAAAMRQEPGWVAAADANCFDIALPGLRRLRVWPNTGCVELVQVETITPRVTSIRVVFAGATLGDVRKLAGVLCGEGRA